MQNKAEKRTIVIGGGPAGLSALKYCSQVTDDIVLYEAKNQVGGMWVYEEHSELTHPNLENDTFYKTSGYLHSSMYDPLVTNVPAFTLSYFDFPLPQSESIRESDRTIVYKKKSPGPSILGSQCPIMLTRAQYLEYLQEYAIQFDLMPRIKLNHVVKKVHYLPHLEEKQEEEWKAKVGTTKKFLLEIISKTEGGEEKIIYDSADYLINANGLYSKPHLPIYKGLEANFKGKHIHMHHVRRLQDIKGKKIMVVGAGMGGMDLVWQLIFNYPTHFQQILYSGNIPHVKKSPELEEYMKEGRITVKGKIKEFLEQDTILFQDESTQKSVDLIVWATGFNYKFPYFEENFQENKIIGGLFDIYCRWPTAGSNQGCKSFGPFYKKIMCAREPDLMFVGVIDRSLFSGIIFDYSAMLCAAHIGGSLKLSREEILKQGQKEVEENKDNLFNYLRFGDFYTACHFMKEIEPVIGINPEQTKEIKAIVDLFHYYFFQLLMKGRFQEVKNFDYRKHVLKNKFYEIWTPSSLKLK